MNFNITLVKIFGTLITLKGVSIDSHNTYRGCVIAFLGDTPAAAMAGGFKEGVGGAYRCCRTCMIKRSDIANKVNNN